jgi:hypothetical protein
MNYIALLACFSFSAAISLAQPMPVKFSEESIGCLNHGALDKKVIIKSAAEYHELFRNGSPHPDCAVYTPPAIDFDHNWLLGFRTKNKGCSPPEYSKEVYATGDEITFKIKVKEKGMCKVLFEEMFWISIPIPTNPNIRFIQE